jgi:PhnB protein
MHVNPYLSFEGRCEEAIEFYKKAVGAKVQQMMRFKDAPADTCGPQVTPGTENKIMHASLTVGDSLMMASDGRCMGQAKFDGISMSLAADNDADAEKYFANLSEGGKVHVPMSKTFFSSRFGMVQDRFGVTWMVIVLP